MDSSAFHVGDEGGASVLLREDYMAAAADTGGNDSYTFPADTSAYTVPAGADIYLLYLYGAFLQTESVVLFKKSGENINA